MSDRNRLHILSTSVDQMLVIDRDRHRSTSGAASVVGYPSGVGGTRDHVSPFAGPEAGGGSVLEGVQPSIRFDPLSLPFWVYPKCYRGSH